MKNINFGCFVVKDIKSEEFGVPFFSPSVEVAKRSICADLIRTTDIIINDLRLFEIAQYDTESASISSYDNYVVVADGDELVKTVNEFRDILSKAKEEIEKEENK